MISGLVKWKKDWALMPDFFDQHEIAKIKDKLKKMKIKNILIIINKNNKHKLIKLKYSIILNMIVDPIIEYINIKR